MAQEIKKVLKLNLIDYYETHLSIINCLFPESARLIPMEIKVLSRFMAIQLGEDMIKYRFSSIGRKIVMEDLGISQSGLSNYLNFLKKKKALIEDDKGELHILPILMPEPDQQYYKFALINIGKNEQVKEPSR